MAWVELNPFAQEIDRFIENVLINRALIQTKVFCHETETRDWLLED
jgi:hypothetical protein